jgi:16S rRNA C1402 N4-methylase RsmH
VFVTAHVVVRRYGAIDAEDAHTSGFLVGQVGVQQQRLSRIREAVRDSVDIETPKLRGVLLIHGISRHQIDSAMRSFEFSRPSQPVRLQHILKCTAPWRAANARTSQVMKNAGTSRHSCGWLDLCVRKLAMDAGSSALSLGAIIWCLVF